MGQTDVAAPVVILIPATSFEMGSPDEPPVHRVELSAFEIAACTVTNAEWSEFASVWTRAEANQAVVSVSWFDAVAYCEWLRETTGRNFRLPTEAEWECAARGGVEGARYPWGNDIPPDNGRWLNGPEPVGRDKPNGFGIHDMCTNVHEWCSDWFAADSYASSPLRDPKGPATGTRRVSRGGSWRHQVKVTRCAARSSIPPEFRYADYGFRVACDPGFGLRLMSRLDLSPLRG